MTWSIGERTTRKRAVEFAVGARGCHGMYVRKTPWRHGNRPLVEAVVHEPGNPLRVLPRWCCAITVGHATPQGEGRRLLLTGGKICDGKWCKGLRRKKDSRWPTVFFFFIPAQQQSREAPPADWDVVYTASQWAGVPCATVLSFRGRTWHWATLPNCQNFHRAASVACASKCSHGFPVSNQSRPNRELDPRKKEKNRRPFNRNAPRRLRNLRRAARMSASIGPRPRSSVLIGSMRFVDNSPAPGGLRCLACQWRADPAHPGQARWSRIDRQAIPFKCRILNFLLPNRSDL